MLSNVSQKPQTSGAVVTVSEWSDVQPHTSRCPFIQRLGYDRKYRKKFIARQTG